MQRPTPDPANEARIAAMYAIHAWAYWPDGNFPDGLPTPKTLAEAADFLAQDSKHGDRFADSRRRRAIGKLAAYGLGRKPFDDALRTLGADPVYIRKQLSLLTPPPSAPRCGGETEPSPTEKETFVDDLYAKVSEDTCPWKMLEAVPPLLGPPVTSTAVTIWIEPALNQVVTALDPQRWAECSKFFDKTFLARLDQNGTVVPDTPVALGTPYGQTGDPRTLYEEYTCDGSGKLCRFTNLLGITTWYESPARSTATCTLPDTSTSRYNIYYGIDKSLAGEIVGVPNTITIDQGQGCAQAETGGGTRAYISKTLQVENPASNGIYQGVASVTFAEMGEEFAEILCCAMPLAAAPQ